jgi:hypothetical protein
MFGLLATLSCSATWMAGAISQPRQSCQFLFCLMKNPLLYRSAWPESSREASERFLMETLGRTQSERYDALERKIIVSGIREQLSDQPDVETKNHKPLRENKLAPYARWRALRRSVRTLASLRNCSAKFSNGSELILDRPRRSV